MTDFPLTLGTLVSGALARHAERPAVVADGRSWTFRELDVASNRLAHALRDMDVSAGTSVALMMSNCVQYVVADLAVAKLGAAKVPLNDMLSSDEATYILRDSGSTVAITSPSQVDVAMAHLDRGEQLGTVIAAGPAIDVPDRALGWDAVLADQPEAAPDVEVGTAEIGLLLYTGGTTGRPKGVVHRSRELALNLLSHRVETEIRPDDRLLLSSPLPHSAGFLLQTALLAGAVTHIERGFDAARIVDAVHDEGVSYLFMVPTMIYRLLDAVRDDPRELSALRTILYGAAPMSPERLQEGLDRFGPVFMQLYGQSEAPNFITRLTREDHVAGQGERLRSCGQPVALAEVRILDDAGEACPPGQAGEVAARTPYTMAGYHGLPEATDKALHGGWLHTGDIGYLDERGYLFLLDRRNDMIISGGMNVYSSEVEAALRGCPGVAQAAVVGVPHPDWGEAVVAYVVPEADGPDLDTEALKAHCRAALSAYKRPKAFHILEALPLTAVGKIDKKSLRASRADRPEPAQAGR
jgi:fatty-acyl-CoA synthase/long-chain acyl-CoA synthetase